MNIIFKILGEKPILKENSQEIRQGGKYLKSTNGYLILLPYFFDFLGWVEVRNQSVSEVLNNSVCRTVLTFTTCILRINF